MRHAVAEEAEGEKPEEEHDGVEGQGDTGGEAVAAVDDCREDIVEEG